MMKKGSLFGLIVLGSIAFSANVFADTSGTGLDLSSIDISELTDQMTLKKESLLDKISSQTTGTKDNYNDLFDDIGDEIEYNILLDNGKIETFKLGDIDDISKSLKNEILLVYSTLISNLSLLKEKNELGLLTDEEYYNEYIRIKGNLETETDIYREKIQNQFETLYNKIDVYGNEYESMKVTEKSFISKIETLSKKLTKVVTLADEFFTKVEDINKLYTIRNDDIYSFMEDLKTLVTTSTRQKLVTLVDNYNIKYPNLSYFRENINKYIQTELDSLNVQLDNKFKNLVGDFYSEIDLNFIETGRDQLKADYYSGDDIKYDALLLTGLSLDEYYLDMNSRITAALSGMNSKMTVLDNAYELSDLKVVLTEKFQDFVDEQFEEIYSDVKDYLNNQKDLAELRLEEDQEKFQTMVSLGNKAIDMLGNTQSKLDNLNTVSEYLTNNKDKLLQSDQIESLEKILREIEYEKVDVQIVVDKLTTYKSSYPGIETKLYNILYAISEDAASKGKTDYLNEKFDSTLIKIEKFMSDQSLSGKSKYVILEIKKAIIKFRYLK